MIKFAQASIDEKGNISGGKAGDQTGNEVNICNPYTHSQGWKGFIHSNKNVNYWTGKNVQVIAGKNVGYDQSYPDRLSLMEACKKAKWEPANITGAYECDCSELVRVCISCAMEKELPVFNTVSLAKTLKAYGYTEVSDPMNHLQHGMILCTPKKGHTVVVFDDTANKSGSTAASTGKQYKVSGNLYYRNGAGTSYQALGVIKSGSVITVSKVSSNNWGYIEGKGWISLNTSYTKAV